MRRIGIALIVTALVFGLAQCELFNTTVEYNVSGGGSTVYIRYQDDKGELVDVTTVPGWSTSFELSSSDRPFLAFIQVTNSGMLNVIARILEEGTLVSSGTAGAGGSVNVYHIVE
jgi:hypothetical protein